MVKLHDKLKEAFKTRALLTGEKGCINPKITKRRTCLNHYFGSFVFSVEHFL